MGLQPPKSPKLVIFGINLQKGVYTLKNLFYKIWQGKEVLGPHAHAKFPHCCFKMWAYSRKKIAKNGNVWYKFAPRQNSDGAQKKLDIDTQLQSILYAMTP